MLGVIVMSDVKEIPVFKFILPSKKIIYLREGKIEDMENAAQRAGLAAGENKAHLGILMQKEQFKTQLVGVQEEGGEIKKLTLAEKQDLNSLLNLGEYAVGLKALDMVNGGSEGTENLQMDLVSFGSK